MRVLSSCPAAARDRLRTALAECGTMRATAMLSSHSPMPATCPFCTLPAERVLHADANAVVIRDGFPVSPGHTLLIPRRHVASFFDLSAAERASLMTLLDWAKAEIEREHWPDGFNIGINDGPAAGQTVSHLHVHLIPRYLGDAAAPRGGVRWVIPTRAKYWD